MIKYYYREDLMPNSKYKTQTILGFYEKSKNNEELPIFELGWKFVWHLIKNRMKGKIYLLASMTPDGRVFVKFFHIKKEKE